MFFAVGSVGLRSSSFDLLVKWITFALPVILILLGAWGIWKKAPYALLLPALVLSGGVIFYLVRDDPVRPPPPNLGMITPPDSASYGAYRWYLKKDPHSRINEFKGKPELPHFPADHAKWAEFAAQHRQVFTQAVANDTLGRDWIEAMARAEPEGIYPPPVEASGAGILAYAPVRYITDARAGYAQVLMLDQRDDEAAALLVPVLRASYHFERGGALLVTAAVAVAIQRRTYNQLELLVASGKLSPASRASIAGVLKEAPPLSLVFDHAYLGEEAFARTGMDVLKGDYGAMVRTLVPEEKAMIPSNHFLWRLFFNPNRSEREYAEFLHEFARNASEREMIANQKRISAFVEEASDWRIKDPVGQLLFRVSLPAFTKLNEAFWKTEDQRVALLQQLEKP